MSLDITAAEDRAFGQADDDYSDPTLWDGFDGQETPGYPHDDIDNTALPGLDVA